jgi:hypothetical protein
MGLRPPLLSEFVIWGDTVTKKPFLHWSVDLRRRHDISHTVVLQGAVTPRRAGGSVGYLRHLGRALTGNDRSWYLGPYLSVNRHMASAAEIAIPERNRFAATMASLSVLAGMNNRAVMLDPGDGGAFSLGMGYAAGVGEDGRSARYGALSVRGGRTAAPAPGHRLALYGGAEGRIGTPPASSLATLSARTALRGFDLDETYGQAALYGVAEWRHTIAGSTGVAFPLGTALDRVQGVLFAGAGTTSPPGGFGGLFHEDNLYAEAGYGLRIFLLALGVAPYLLAVDFAAPIYPLSRYREVRRSDGVTVRERRSPFRFVLGITQTF